MPVAILITSLLLALRAPDAFARVRVLGVTDFALATVVAFIWLSAMADACRFFATGGAVPIAQTIGLTNSQLVL